MSLSDEVRRRQAEAERAAAEAEATKLTPPFFGLSPRFTAIRADRIAGGGPWFVELVNELMRHPGVFDGQCLARRLDETTYEYVDEIHWTFLQRSLSYLNRREKKEVKARIKGIKQSLHAGDIFPVGFCALNQMGEHPFFVLANGLVNSTAALPTEAALRAEAIELIMDATERG